MHKKALIAGIGAIFCWSLMVGFLRLTTVNYGSELGIALIYTLGAVFLFLLDKPITFQEDTSVLFADRWGALCHLRALHGIRGGSCSG